jgi:hypothetical protein
VTSPRQGRRSKKSGVIIYVTVNASASEELVPSGLVTLSALEPALALDETEMIAVIDVELTTWKLFMVTPEDA